MGQYQVGEHKNMDKEQLQERCEYLERINQEVEYYNKVFRTQCVFIAASYKCTNYNELLETLNETLEDTEKLDWHCSLFLKTEEGEIVSKTGGQATPSQLHKQIMEQAWEKKGNIQKGSFAAVPSQCFSFGILLRNLPNDPIARETTISSMKQILDIFEKRLKDFRIQRNLRAVVSLAHDELSEHLVEYNKQAEDISELLSQIADKVEEKDLDSIQDITIQALGEISRFDVSRQTNESVIRRLYNALQNPDAKDMEDENLDVQQMGGNQEDIDSLLADLGL